MKHLGHSTIASPRRAQFGLTLIELLVTMVVIAVLATIAAPSFRGLIVDQRLTNAASAVNQSVWLARSEALKRNTSVGFTISNISNGWSIDINSQTVRSETGFEGINAAARTFTFNGTGRLIAGEGNYELQYGSSSDKRCITITPSGKTSSRSGACPT